MFQQGYRIPFKIWRFLCSICELFFLTPLSWSPRELLEMLALGDQTSSGSVNQTGETNSRDKVLPETPSGVVCEDKLEVQVPADWRGERQQNHPELVKKRKKQPEVSKETARVMLSSGMALPRDSEELSTTTDCAVSTELQLTWKATSTFGCFPAPGTRSSMHLHKIAQGLCSSVSEN